MNNFKKVDFPFIELGEFTVLRPFTAPGLFAYRYIQAIDLLHNPDFGGGDMTTDERINALDEFVNLQRPLTAIVIFLNVVALEDFIRDLGIRLAKIEGLDLYFPKISSLNLKIKKADPQKPSKKLDDDPTSLIDFEKLNELYFSIIGVEPINKLHFKQLYDLAIIRHSVAHNGSIIRTIDIPRFQYYNVIPNITINPPPKFVKETCLFIYEIGRTFENTIRDVLFEKVITSLSRDWFLEPPKIIIDLITLFNYFGFLPTTQNIFSEDIDVLKEDNKKKTNELIKLCIEELVEKFNQ